jgi:hypothetical protein
VTLKQSKALQKKTGSQAGAWEPEKVLFSLKKGFGGI